MRKVVLGLIGGLLILSGAIAMFFGALLVGVFGGDGRIDTDPVRINSTATALSSDIARIDAGLPSGFNFAEVYISATSVSGKDVFVGVGPARDVLSYLSGVPYDVVTDVSGRPGDEDSINLRRVRGEGTPPAPSAEAFWVEQSSGSGRQDISWPIKSGKYLFVVMNADGSPNVDVQATVGISAPWLFSAGLGAVIAGLVLIILGAVSLFFGFRKGKNRPELVYATPGSAVANDETAVDRPSYVANPPATPGEAATEPAQSPPREADESAP